MSDDKLRSVSLTDRVSRRRGLCREAGSRYGHRQSSCVPKLRADRRPAWDRQRRISQPAHERESCRPALRRQDLGRHAGFRHTNGLPTSQRLAIRQQKVVPLIASLVCWMRAARGQMSRHVDIALCRARHSALYAARRTMPSGSGTTHGCRSAVGFPVAAGSVPFGIVWPLRAPLGSRVIGRWGGSGFACRPDTA